MMSSERDFELGPDFEGSENIQKMDCESLNTLIHQYDQALEENFSKKNQFRKFKDDYLKLKARLQTLPNKLEYDAMVPISSKALCPGKIIHTNEILCLLGENLFVECTAKKACEIVAHRLKNIEETLTRLDTENKLYNSWKLEAERQMVETLGEGSVEIVEQCSEDELSNWRKKHRESLRKHHQNLGKERLKKASSTAVDNVGLTEEDKKFWTRLDALELEEEFMEAQALYEEKVSTATPVAETKYTAKIREKEKSKPKSLETDNKDENYASNNATSASGKKVTFSPENIVHNLENLNIKDSKKKSKDNDVSEVKEEVELYKPSEVFENGLYDPIFIRFRHEVPTATATQDSPDEDDLVNSDSDSDSDDDEDYQIVTSPGDIYEQFGPPSLDAKAVPVPGADKTPLKSILKPKKLRNPEEIILTDRSGLKLSHKQVKVTICPSKGEAVQRATAADIIELPNVTERVPNSTNATKPKPQIEINNEIYNMFPYMKQTPKQAQPPSAVSQNAVNVNTDKPDVVEAPAAPKGKEKERPVSLFKKMKGKVSFDDNTTATNN